MNYAASRRELLKLFTGLVCVARASAAHGETDESPQSALPRPSAIGALDSHTVVRGELLHDLARQYDLGFVELRAANPGIDAWTPPIGAQLVIPSQHILPADSGHRIVINIGDMRLYWYGLEAQDVRSWPIGIGREAHETPVGVLAVTEKRPHPTWRPTPGQRADDPTLPAAVGPGPDNPLGDYALRVGWDGYNIHGTNKPDSIGRRLTRGCIRLYPEDIQTLFGLASLGDSVRITDEPVKLAWIGDQLYLQAHVVGAQVEEVELGHPMALEPAGDLESRIQYIAGSRVGRVDWGRVRTVVAERRGVPTQITA
jgi:L,D-transpeptidase ErfK/SrfK